MFNWIQMLDNFLLFYIQENLRTPLLDKVMPLITKLGDGGALWIILMIIFLISKKYRKIGVMIFLGLGFCFITGNLILKPLIARTRPFDLLGYSQLFIQAPKDFSFPSGHTMASFASAVVLWKNNRTMGTAALIIAILIGFSRLYLFVHFPSDVVAGIVLGSLWGILAVKSYSKLVKNFGKNLKADPKEKI